MTNSTINIINNTYERTGQSKKTDSKGMREMQQRAYEMRNSKHLIIKAPPASGKSRALMFIALDKIYKQGLKKIIVAVPETSIGASFSDTNLTDANLTGVDMAGVTLFDCNLSGAKMSDGTIHD